jgi:LysR family glycine cleavage system transcriptional activator
MPPVAALRDFAALAETGAAGKAGAALNVSHAAISQHVRALEARLEVRLIRRDGRGVALTGEGRVLADGLLGAFRDIRAARDIFELDMSARPVRVSVTPNFAANWLMPRLAGFQATHPEVELMIHPSPDIVTLGPDGFDMAIRYGDGTWPGLEVYPLLNTSIVILAARDLLKGRTINSPSDLLDLPWLQELGTDEITQWLAKHGVTGRRARMIHLPGNFVLEAIRRGDGISATARAFAQDDIDSGRLLVLYEDVRPGDGYHIVLPPGVHRASVKAFTAWLRRQAGGQAATRG